MTVQGVILDVDGTLILSNDAHAQAWVEAAAAFGYHIHFEQVRPLIGMGGDHLIPIVLPELNNQDGDGKAISERRKELILNKFVSHLSPTDGARELLLKMQQEGLKLVVASSATNEELTLLLKGAQVDDLLPQEVITDKTPVSKPAADPVAAALKILQMPPDQVIMIGDTPYDIESAQKCGVGTIAVRSGGFSDEQLASAIAIYDNPADLLAHYADSPLAKTLSFK